MNRLLEFSVPPPHLARVQGLVYLPYMVLQNMFLSHGAGHMPLKGSHSWAFLTSPFQLSCLWGFGNFLFLS